MYYTIAAPLKQTALPVNFLLLHKNAIYAN